MTRTTILAAALAGFLGGCPAVPNSASHSAGTQEEPMIVHGLAIEAIEPDHRIRLANGLVIEGDARLASALRDGGAGISAITLLEIMPPAVLVDYADGTNGRYRSRRATP